MTWKTWLVLLVILAGGAFLFGRSSVAPGISPSAAADLARRAGDSAVASYSKPIAQVIGRLVDSVQYYKGTSQAGAKIVVGHQTVAIHDAGAVQASAAPTGAGVDTVQVPMPAIDSAGLQLAETLTVSPRPSLVRRAAWFTVDPDTILVALLKTPEGLQRFTAVGTAAGLRVSVVDAAAVAPTSHATARTAVTVLGISGCLLAGYELGRANTNAPLTIAGGALCLGGGVIRIGL